jgi:hypothetical protein
MTLGEALAERYWMADPWNDKVARVCGPDSKVSFIVEEVDGGGFDCWIRDSKGGKRLSDIERVGGADEVEGALERLTRLREQAGDCPLCGSPMWIGGGTVGCGCGYEVEIEVETEVVCE